MSLPSSAKSFRRAGKAGFTLVEMIVSIAIMGAVVSTILLNQSTYTEGARLTAQADELASRVSEAQAYGVAVRERSAGTGDFSIAYGVSVSILASGSPNAYIVFIDRNGNQVYDGDWTCPVGETSECLEKVSLTNGNAVDSLCIAKISGTDDCSAPKRADILFLRPDPQAHITVWNSSGTVYAPTNMAGVRFILKSTNSLSRSVSSYTTGQVSVQ
jgi:prepilin-type N-terminal cleavage/methylation domain-containing protein